MNRQWAINDTNAAVVRMLKRLIEMEQWRQQGKLWENVPFEKIHLNEFPLSSAQFMFRLVHKLHHLGWISNVTFLIFITFPIFRFHKKVSKKTLPKTFEKGITHLSRCFIILRNASLFPFSILQQLMVFAATYLPYISSMNNISRSQIFFYVFAICTRRK